MAHVLISGIGIAGPVLAYWLAENGHAVTMIERAAYPRPGGQAVDVRGAALEVLQRMNLLEAVGARRTSTKGVSVVGADGVEQWRSVEGTLSGGRFDAGDVEILRDDLASILLDAISDRAEFLFDDAAVEIRQGPDGVDVQFRSGRAHRYDIVIGADGIASKVRRLAFDVDDAIHSLGVGLAVFTAPNLLQLQDWQIAHREGRGGFLIYTAHGDRELRIAVGFALEPHECTRLDVTEQKALVASRCAHFRWRMPELLANIETAPDFYFGPVAQVRLKDWAVGRVALVGDAAYSPSPFSGQGTSLALVGAYILADELGADTDNYEAAFLGYQHRMQDYVELNQALAMVDEDADEKDDLLSKAKWAVRLDRDPGAAPEAANAAPASLEKG